MLFRSGKLPREDIDSRLFWNALNSWALVDHLPCLCLGAAGQVSPNGGGVSFVPSLLRPGVRVFFDLFVIGVELWLEQEDNRDAASHFLAAKRNRTLTLSRHRILSAA